MVGWTIHHTSRPYPDVCRDHMDPTSECMHNPSPRSGYRNGKGWFEDDPRGSRRRSEVRHLREEGCTFRRRVLVRKPRIRCFLLPLLQCGDPRHTERDGKHLPVQRATCDPHDPLCGAMTRVCYRMLELGGIPVSFQTLHMMRFGVSPDQIIFSLWGSYGSDHDPVIRSS